MPFGVRIDPRSGIEIDFDAIYDKVIQPTIEAAGLEQVRSDAGRTGGILHSEWFARLLLSEFVIVDLTTARPEAFMGSGFGMRQSRARRSRSSRNWPPTSLVWPALTSTPRMWRLSVRSHSITRWIRAIPYELDGGVFSDEGAHDLAANLTQRIDAALVRSGL